MLCTSIYWRTLIFCSTVLFLDPCHINCTVLSYIHAICNTKTRSVSTAWYKISASDQMAQCTKNLYFHSSLNWVLLRGWKEKNKVTWVKWKSISLDRDNSRVTPSTFFPSIAIEDWGERERKKEMDTKARRITKWAYYSHTHRVCIYDKVIIHFSRDMIYFLSTFQVKQLIKDSSFKYLIWNKFEGKFF